MRIDYLNDKMTIKTSKFEYLNTENVKKFINNFISEKLIYNKYFNCDNFEKLLLKNCSTQESKNDLILDVFNDKSAVIGCVPMTTFMWLEIPSGPPIGGLYDALAAPLTEIGNLQLHELEEILKSCNTICNGKQSAYAPFTAFIQSSGFGKTKLCLESLKKHPGLYIVFRRENDKGIPAMSKWMKRFQKFVLDAPKDSIPDDDSDLYGSRVGKFLLGLLIILEEYKTCFEKWEAYLKSRNYIVPKSEEECKLKAIEKFGESFIRDPESESNTNPGIIFNPNFKSNDKAFDLSKFKIQVNDAFSKIAEILPKSCCKFPFILYLDELELMTFPYAFGRASAVNVIRRALHVMNSSFNFMVVAIGTNSDALSLSPAIRDDSLRISEKYNLLPASFLSGNWEVLSGLVKYCEVELSIDDLRNRALFNVLVSFGRALWSSCGLANVIATAESKLRNGNRNSFGALLALLLVRANISVNTHHVLARNLIRSYMAIVSYVSTDSHDIKIGYSSEPVLAMASRSMLRERSTRSDALEAFKEFLEKGVIDKGRIVETLFEHVTLFALDDAEPAHELYDNPDNVPEQLRKLTNCKSHILEIIDFVKKDIGWEEAVETSETGEAGHMEVELTHSEENMPRETSDPIQAEKEILSVSSAIANISIQSSETDVPHRDYAAIRYVDVKMTHYHVSTVRYYLQSFLGTDRFNAIEGMIESKLLDGIVNISHYVQLEKLRNGDFKGLENVPKVQSMKKSVIDKALLACGILRQCGFIMPPNYFGIDFIVPFVFIDDASTKRPIYSFIAFQSKSKKENIFQCASKMSMNLHYCLCTNPNHNEKSAASCSPEKSKCTLFEDYQTICQNQISIVLIAAETAKRRVKPEVCLSLYGIETTYEFPENPELLESLKNSAEGANVEVPAHTQISGKRAVNFDAGNEKTKYAHVSTFAKEAWSFEKELKKTISINEEIKGPLFKLTEYPSYLKTVRPRPDAVIKKIFDNNLAIVQLIWNRPVEKHLESEGSESKRTKSIHSESGTTFSPSPSKRSNTCIICQGISSFKHFFDARGNNLYKYILNFETSNFNDVDMLQLPLVQSSMLRGKFSPYYQVNPMLLEMKGLEKVSNPTETYSDIYTSKNWQNSVEKCVRGPADAVVTGNKVEIEIEIEEEEEEDVEHDED